MFVDIARQIIVENIAMAFNFSKKDPATKHVLKTKLSFNIF